ncbi:integrase, catalytic region, zinc finger, CCHC-type containing protein [Tanacetum coccineum]
MDKPITHEITVLVKDLLIPLAEKTRVNASEFERVLKEEMFDDLQDIVITELKKIIEKSKGKSVKTKFYKPSVVRQTNAIKVPKPSVLGKPTPFLDSLEKRKNLKPRLVTKTDVTKGLSKPVTIQILPNTQTGKQAGINKNIVQIIIFIVDSGCTKHMTGNLKLLCNFVEKYLGMIWFGNDQFAPIIGYGDLVQGNIMIKRVFVEGLNHNLFSVGQFCDADMEVAFRKSTCYIKDLQGNDLLTGTRGFDLYIIALQESSSPTPICFLAKASPNQAWLWHRRLSHLNFNTINLLSKNNIVKGLPKLKFVKDQLCSSCEIVRDGKNLDKMKEKGDPCIFVGYSTTSKGYRVYNKRNRLNVESIYINFDEIKEMTSDHNKLETNVHNNEPLSSKLVPNDSPPANKTDSSLQELNFLISPFFEEYFTIGNQNVSKSSALSVNSKQQDTQPTANVQPTTKPITPTTNVNAEENNTNQAVDAQFVPYEFFNPFCTPEAMADHAWIEAMQEELHQFNRLKVWELVDKPFGKTDPEEDLADYPADGGDDDDDDDKEEEEEDEASEEDEEEDHLALADSTTLLAIDPVLSAEDTEAFETDESAPTPPPPRSPRTKVPFSQTSLYRELKTIPSPPLPVLSPPLPLPSPPTYTSPTYADASLGYKAAMIQLRAASLLPVPSPPLLLPSTSHRDDIPEANMLLRKRACFSALASGFEVEESSVVAARQAGHALTSSVDYGFINTVDTSIHASKSRAMTSVREVNKRVTDLATIHGHDAHELYVHYEDAQDDRALMRAQISLLVRERRYFRSMTSSYEREAVIPRQAWTESESRSQAMEAQIRAL